MIFKYSWEENRLSSSSNNYSHNADLFSAPTEGYRNRIPGNEARRNKVDGNQDYRGSNDPMETWSFSLI